MIAVLSVLLMHTGLAALTTTSSQMEENFFFDFSENTNVEGTGDVYFHYMGTFTNSSIIDMGAVTLDSVTEAPDTGYTDSATIADGHVYIVRTVEDNYVKFLIHTTDMVYMLDVEFVIQDDGSRTLVAAAEPTPEPTPEPTAEATPEPTTEATPEPTTEATPEPTPEATPEATPEPAPEATPEPTPEATPEPAIDVKATSKEEKVRINKDEPVTFCGVNVTFAGTAPGTARVEFSVLDAEGQSDVFMADYDAVRSSGLEDRFEVGEIVIVVRKDCLNFPSSVDIHVNQSGTCRKDELTEKYSDLTELTFRTSTIKHHEGSGTGEAFIFRKGVVYESWFPEVEGLAADFNFNGTHIRIGGINGVLAQEDDFDSVGVATPSGYQWKNIPTTAGAVYIFQTADEKYAKLVVKEVSNESMTFKWAYQPDGTGYFFDVPDTADILVGQDPEDGAVNVSYALTRAHLILNKTFFDLYMGLMGNNTVMARHFMNITATILEDGVEVQVLHDIDFENSTIIVDLTQRLDPEQEVSLHITGFQDPWDNTLLDYRWGFTTAEKEKVALTWLELGTAVTATAEPGKESWYGFNLTVPTEVSIAVDAATAGPVAALVLDVTSPDAIVEVTATEEVALTVLNPGTYLVRLATTATESADVTLTVSESDACPECLTDEAGSTPDTAAILALGREGTGVVTCTALRDACDTDLYGLILATDSKVSVSFHASDAHGTSWKWTKATIVDSEGNVLTVMDSGGDKERIEVLELAAGTYGINIAPNPVWKGFFRYALRADTVVACGGLSCPANAECIDDACQCASGFKECDEACIADDQCCTDADCPEGACLENRTCEGPAATPEALANATANVTATPTPEPTPEPTPMPTPAVDEHGLEHFTTNIGIGQVLSLAPLGIMNGEDAQPGAGDIELLPGGTLKARSEKSGLLELNATSVEDVKEVPGTGYKQNLTLRKGMVLAVRTQKGTYAIGIVTTLQLNPSVEIEWTHQPDGSRGVAPQPTPPPQTIVEKAVTTVKEKPIQSAAAGAAVVAVAAGAVQVLGGGAAATAAAGAAGAAGAASAAAGAAGAASATTASVTSAMAAGASVSGGAAGGAAGAATTTAAGSAAAGSAATTGAAAAGSAATGAAAAGAGTASAVAASTGSATAAASAIQSIGGQGIAFLAKKKAYGMAMNKVQDKIKDRMVDKGVQHLAAQCAAPALLAQAEQMEAEGNEDLAETYRIANQILLMLYRSPQTSPELSKAMWGGDVDYAKPIIDMLIEPLGILDQDSETGIYAIMPEEYQLMHRWVRAADLQNEISIVLDGLTGDVGLGTIKNIKETYQTKWRRPAEEEEAGVMFEEPPAYFKEEDVEKAEAVQPLVDPVKRRLTNFLEEKLATELSRHRFSDLAGECMLGSLFADRYRASSADIAKQVSDGYQVMLVLYRMPLTEGDLDKVIWKEGYGKSKEYIPGMIEKGWVVFDEVTGLYSFEPEAFKDNESFLRLTGLKGVVDPIIDLMIGAKDAPDPAEGVETRTAADPARRELANVLEERLNEELSKRGLEGLGGECLLARLLTDQYRETDPEHLKELADCHQVVLVLHRGPLSEDGLNRVIWKEGEGKAGVYLQALAGMGCVVYDEATGTYRLDPNEQEGTGSYLRLTGLKGVVDPVLDMMVGAKDTTEVLGE